MLNPVSVSSVMSALQAIDPKKATGVDDLDPLFLCMAASLITEPLTHIFNLSITTGVVPMLWKAAHVTPLHKGGDKTFTFRAFSRGFYPKRLTISTFVIRSATIHRYRYSKEKLKY